MIHPRFFAAVRDRGDRHPHNGQIVGEYFISQDGNRIPEGFLYSDGVFSNFSDPSAVYGTIPGGINNAGQIVGYYYDASDIAHGFIYSNGSYTTLNDPLGISTFAFGINDRGQVSGNISTGAVWHQSWIAMALTPPLMIHWEFPQLRMALTTRDKS